MNLSDVGCEPLSDIRHRPRLLSDNGPCYVSGELKKYLERHGIEHTKGAPYHPSDDSGENRAVSPLHEERYQAPELLPPK
ncbi:MAG: hypothetical protein ABIK83_09105 [Candidatus Zixiibacteriota bacterium]